MTSEAPPARREAPFSRRRGDVTREQIAELAKLHFYCLHSVRTPETLYLICLNRAGREVCVTLKAPEGGGESALTLTRPEALEYGEMDFLHVSPGVITAQWKRKVESFSGDHGITSRKGYPMVDVAEISAASTQDFDDRAEGYYRREANAEFLKSKEALDRANALAVTYEQKSGEIRKSLSATVTVKAQVDELVSEGEWSLERSKELAQLNGDIFRSLSAMRAVTDDLLRTITA